MAYKSGPRKPRTNKRDEGLADLKHRAGKRRQNPVPMPKSNATVDNPKRGNSSSGGITRLRPRSQEQRITSGAWAGMTPSQLRELQRPKTVKDSTRDPIHRKPKTALPMPKGTPAGQVPRKSRMGTVDPDWWKSLTPKQRKKILAPPTFPARFGSVGKRSRRFIRAV